MITDPVGRPWHVAAVRLPRPPAPRRPNRSGTGRADGSVDLPAVALRHRPPVPGRPLDADDVGTLLHRTAGLSRFLWRRTSETLSGTTPHDAPTSVVGRPVPSGGRCYPLEVTLALGGVAGVPDGSYRYDPYRHRLLRLDDHDVRADPPAPPAGVPGRAPALLLAVTVVEERATDLYGPLGQRLASLEAGATAFQAVAAGRTVGLAGSVHLRPGGRVVRSAPVARPGGRTAAVVVFETGAAGRPQAAMPGLLDPEPAVAAAIARRSSTALGYRRGELPEERARALLRTLRAPVAVDAPDTAPRLYVATQRVPGVARLWTGGPRACEADRASAGPPVPPALAVAATSRVLRRECLEANFVVAAVAPSGTGASGRPDAASDPRAVASGMAVQQAALAAAAAGLGSRMHCDFDADGVRHALGLPPGGDGGAVLLTIGRCPVGRTRPEHPLL